ITFIAIPKGLSLYNLRNVKINSMLRRKDLMILKKNEILNIIDRLLKCGNYNKPRLYKQIPKG
ncbi:hypothetical protein, partial [Leptospira interrogans]|uniref:hypothetical protein n=1 Tax=Leptospira interrogans TaxID=173 RepID=UPI0004A873FB